MRQPQGQPGADNVPSRDESLQAYGGEPVVDGGLAGLRGAVDALARVDAAELGNDALGKLIVEVSRQRDRLEAVLARAVAVQGKRTAWRDDGARSQAQWLADRCAMSMGQAAGTARTAQGLADLPETADALADGRMSSGQARVAVNAARDLPASARDGLDRLVADEAAAGTDPAALRKTADDYAHRAAPDSLAEREQRAWRNRRLSVAKRGDGAFGIDGLLDPVGAEALQAALAPLAAPHDAADDRTPEQRRADALVALARRRLDAGCLPETGGTRPHVTVTVPLDTLRGQPGAPAASLDLAGAVCAETARMLACDAGVSRVITAGASQPLDTGRETRVVTTPQRRALAARDGGCIGCNAPAGWCQAHHIVHWADGGATDLHNLVLLCHGCHRAVHHQGWTIHRRPDGTFALHRPTAPPRRATAAAQPAAAHATARPTAHPPGLRQPRLPTHASEETPPYLPRGRPPHRKPPPSAHPAVPATAHATAPSAPTPQADTRAALTIPHTAPNAPPTACSAQTTPAHAPRAAAAAPRTPTAPSADTRAAPPRAHDHTRRAERAVG